MAMELTLRIDGDAEDAIKFIEAVRNVPGFVLLSSSFKPSQGRY